jgi:predicted ester cyclase
MLSVASRTLSATGKSFSVAETIIFRLVEGKVREVWPVWDRLSLLEQLGAIPA